MKWIAIIGRTLLGLLYLFAVLNFVFHFGEAPKLSGDAAGFAGAMMNSGFMWVVKVIEFIAAILLLSGQYVRLAALLALPITINILLFHALLVQSGLAIPSGMLLINVYLFYYYYEDFKVALKRQ